MIKIFVPHRHMWLYWIMICFQILSADVVLSMLCLIFVSLFVLHSWNFLLDWKTICALVLWFTMDNCIFSYRFVMLSIVDIKVWSICVCSSTWTYHSLCTGVVFVSMFHRWRYIGLVHKDIPILYALCFPPLYQFNSSGILSDHMQTVTILLASCY